MASSILPTKVIAGVTVVDTPLVRAAQEYARAHGDDMTFNHVMRSWLFGVIIYHKLRAKDAFPSVDLEVHALSAILHDLGWDTTGELISNDKRFEVDGAIAAKNWIKERQENGMAKDWDEHKLQLVWDAIALHTTPSIAAYKQAEVSLCGLGIVTDFQGPYSDPTQMTTWDEFNAVKAEFPRLDLAGGIRKMMCGFCKTKPQTTYGSNLFAVLLEDLANLGADTFMMAFGRKHVEGYKTDGNLSIDIMDNCIE
ncbi:hypothetical protein NA57DRAFT_79821 [Rhizodiscina lignyota]|uniref:HD domain-containing protein n=1 Tax=Rhizodiscina lignyota TaxID=1504668 RepID=A0A9P4I547_9PEZI|nr:hypothetical protein NA57DRAFT_79821 [Rhizodiscina lignyota]